LKELKDLPVVTPDGGWSLLIDTMALGFKPEEASRKLFEAGGIAATPMTGWGQDDRAGRYLRFVFANEPVSRMTDLRERVRKAWAV
jgi:aspartate/methionine/tyrosine aminotransferase